MWPIPIELIGRNRLSVFALLLVYIVGFLLLTNLFLTTIITTSKLKANQIIKSPTLLHLKAHSTLERVQKRSIKSENKNDSRRSNSTKVWSRRQENLHDSEGNPSGVNQHYINYHSSNVFHPWMNDKNCQNYSVRFAKKFSFKPRALVSFPGSGNSWLRYLIESSTGIFTGSIFNDRNLYEFGLYGELTSPNDGTTIVQKTHHDGIIGPILYNPNKRSVNKLLRSYVKLSELLFGYRGILLLRNPYDALLSYSNYLQSKSHTGHAGLEFYSTPAWKKFVTIGSSKWATVIEDWVKNSQDLHIVLYENLKAHPKEELIKILNYMNLSVDQNRLNCVLSHLEGPFHRNKSISPISKEAEQSYNNTPLLLTSLDLIVKESIIKVNNIFQHYNIPVKLNYTLEATKKQFF